MGEQPNPLDLPSPRMRRSRHRGAKPPSMNLGDKPVIPGVAFIRWAMALPLGTTRITKSCKFPICSTCYVAVKLPLPLHLEWFPSILRELLKPLRYFCEATRPSQICLTDSVLYTRFIIVRKFSIKRVASQHWLTKTGAPVSQSPPILYI